MMTLRHRLMLLALPGILCTTALPARSEMVQATLGIEMNCPYGLAA